MSTPQSELASNNFSKGDIVNITGLKSKPHWNGKLATIIGQFVDYKQRYPIQLNSDKGIKVLLKAQNLVLHRESGKPKFSQIELLIEGFARVYCNYDAICDDILSLTAPF